MLHKYYAHCSALHKHYASTVVYYSRTTSTLHKHYAQCSILQVQYINFILSPTVRMEVINGVSNQYSLSYVSKENRDLIILECWVEFKCIAQLFPLFT